MRMIPRFIIIVFFCIVQAILFINLSIMNFGLSLLLILAPVLFIYPRLCFFSFIFVRPIVDIYSEIRFGGAMNLASIFTMALIFICGAELIIKGILKEIRKNIVLVNINKLFLLLLFVSLFSVFYSRNVMISVVDFLRLFSVFVIFNYVSLCFTDEKDKVRVIFLILASSLIPLFIGFCQFLFEKGNVYTFGFNRIYGTFAHPNVFAQFLLLIFLLLLLVLNNYKVKQIYSWGLFLYSLLIVFSIYHTFTRGIWISMMLAIFIFVLVKTKITKKIGYLLLIFFIVLCLSPFIMKRWEDISLRRTSHGNSLEWRMRVWQKTIIDLKRHPVIGNGLGMYQYNMGKMVHNDYLRICYEVGILGLTIYLFLLFYILFSFIRRLLMSKTLAEINSSKIGIAIIVCLLVISLADNLVRSTVIFSYYFLSLGLLFNEQIFVRKREI